MIKTADEFLTAIKERRSYYGISKEEIVSQERIEKIVEEAILHTPTSFNSQSCRAVILFNEEHDALWNLTEDKLKEIVPADAFEATQERIASFRNGYGTVLFFEDQTVVKSLQDNFPSYAEKFPDYAQNSSGMLQLIVWTALEQEGLGATLQHYQPLIDAGIQEKWNVPESWLLTAQMPFGKPTFAPAEKEFQPIDERLKVFK